MATRTSKNPLKHLRASDARAVAQLATKATTGVVNIAEGVHQSVWQTLGVSGGKAPGQTGGLTGLVYQSVRGVTQLVGKGLDALLTRLQPVFEAADRAAPETPQREAVLAALNGVLGDRLAESHSPLATAMTLRHGGAALNWQNLPPSLNAGSKVLVLIHGLCMNDLQWHSQAHNQAGPQVVPDAAELTIGHGTALARTMGYTPVYVRYNTGLHTSQNGAELSRLLELLVAHWPTPVEELTVVAHSMGGLVTRSAVHQATHQVPAAPGKSAESGKAALRWPSLLKNIVFLGTPHHGAPLERAGNWVDVVLGSTRYSKPFARLAQLRSAGITDLRYGHVLDADWQGHDRFRKKPDSRVHVPLPEGVACFTIAATAAAQRGSVADRLIGDGLVPLNSALGLHDDPQRCLHFAKKSQLIAYSTNHMQLLSSPAVTRQMVAWLGPKARQGAEQESQQE
jgi:pimeloyl-ACP methyl ester carboxylesterase